MLQNVKKGNAVTDGKEFRFWIVGPIEKWCKEHNIPFEPEKYGLRNTNQLEIKWGMYHEGDSRLEWASCSSMVGISILIRGDSTFYFRDADNHKKCREVRLKKEGDYVLWVEEVEHTWEMHEDSTFLTVRWPSRPVQLKKI